MKNVIQFLTRINIETHMSRPALPNAALRCCPSVLGTVWCLGIVAVSRAPWSLGHLRRAIPAASREGRREAATTQEAPTRETQPHNTSNNTQPRNTANNTQQHTTTHQHHNTTHPPSQQHVSQCTPHRTIVLVSPLVS